MLSRLSLNVRIITLSCAIALITTLTISLIAYQQSKKQVTSLGGEMFTKINHDVIGLMEALNAQVVAGKITLEEAKDTVRTYVNGPQRADGSRDITKTKLSTDEFMYVWAFSGKKQGLVEMHPFPLEGKGIWDYNIEGKYTVRDSWGNISNVGKTFHEIWQNPGEPVYTFLAYQSYFEPWDWVVGVGAREELLYQARLAETRNQILIYAALIFVLSFAASWWTAHKISKVVKETALSLAGGAHAVFTSSQQIANSAQALSQSATEQASSLEETVAAMEELTSMVRMNTDNSKQAATVASATRDVAHRGEREIKTLIDSIHSISADSKKIEEITGVIDDIAFQTNLLALNAAVEAARAGEQGKGFAVVAEAVRSLAQRSSVAAKDIAELIKKSVEKIETGSRQANQGGIVLSEIVESVKKVSDLNNEIATASEEQSTGIAQISKAMNQMDQVTQVNASSSEEAAAAAEELSTLSATMESNVVVLERIIFGSEIKNEHAQEQSVSKPAVTLKNPRQAA